MKKVLGILLFLFALVALFGGGYFFIIVAAWGLYQDIVNSTLTFWGLVGHAIWFVLRGFFTIVIVGVSGYFGYRLLK